jgi:replicative DNA helicase
MWNELARDEMLERPLPNSAEAERAVLGAIMLDNSLIMQAAEQVAAEDFYVPSHRRIFLAMLALAHRGSEINQVLIAEELRRDGEIESVGGITYITNLMTGLPHFTDLGDFTTLIRNKSLLRLFVKENSRAVSEALEEEDLPEVIFNRHATAVLQLQQAGTGVELHRAHDLTTSALERTALIAEQGSNITGVSSGFADLDAMTLGWQPGDLVIIAARPSLGKTSLALGIGVHAALHAARNVLFFSLEMSKEQIAARILSSEARVDSNRMRSGFLNNEEWGRLSAANQNLEDARFWVCDKPAVTTDFVRWRVLRTIAELGEVGLIVVDYVQLMSGIARRAESRQQEVSAISRELKAIARDTNVPLIALSQLSRAPEQRTNHKPQLSDLRETGALEQDADVVAFIYRPEQYDATEQNAGIAEILVEKQRNGPTGTVRLTFIKEFTRFENMWQE